MKSEIETAINTLASVINTSLSAPQAQQYTQAICNLAHAYGVLENAERQSAK